MIKKFYRRIIDGVPNAVVVADRKLKAVFSNASFRKLFSPLAEKGDLGEVTRCGNGVCSACLSRTECSLHAAFEDCFATGKPVIRRVFQTVNTGDGAREVSYGVTVTPLDAKLCMATVDDGLELEISSELQTAKSIQQNLLPVGNWAGGKRYCFFYQPCREIGGDLVDVYENDGSAMGIIADVSGKGISAGILSAFVKAAFDKGVKSPAEAISKLASKFCELNLDERNYVTVAAVKIGKDSVTYSMAGHNVPILLKTGSGITRIVLNSPPVSNWFDNPSYFEDVIPYKKGDILVLLTDGVTECKNARGEFFGADGAIKTLSLSRTGEEFIKRLEDNLKSWCPVHDDDMTAIAFDL